MTATLRLLLADDQAIVRDGLRALLSLQPDLSVVGEAENGRQLLERLAALAADDALPDVVLMDVRMPQMDGVAATREVVQRYPAVKVLVLTTFDRDDYVAQAVRYGAAGYLLKDTPAPELADAIRAVARGYAQFGPGLLAKAIAPPVPPPPPALAALTPREREVLRHLGTGATNREIARALFLAEGTVKNYVSSILSQLGAIDRVRAALLARTYLAPLPELPGDAPGETLRDRGKPLPDAD